jgi:hypothetical protein
MATVLGKLFSLPTGCCAGQSDMCHIMGLIKTLGILWPGCDISRNLGTWFPQNPLTSDEILCRSYAKETISCQMETSLLKRNYFLSNAFMSKEMISCQGK